ncbi:Rhodanese-related sulfurtransferase [Fontimonas thermophila]|uniref:Rhodanese-related sulfurtransferase n=1 Tax=Fontimonas thermophila TaxID=1076937 RepID=A0A1I2J978_9GAMM|nr:rhodanese-like domain-containing protein [Fontimonas thermophila]SFF51325.1 Rhodanese-related sulfurtransferase [Fontimonas thermophila]
MAQFIEFVSNHPVLFALLGVLLILFIANEIHGAIAGGKRLSVPEAVRLINDRDPIILDVRPPADFKKGHLLHAYNAPITKLDEHIGQFGKDKTRPILVYCALGSTAVTAAERLRKNGFAEVYPLRGGLNAWLGANLPVTTR